MAGSKTRRSAKWTNSRRRCNNRAIQVPYPRNTSDGSCGATQPRRPCGAAVFFCAPGVSRRAADRARSHRGRAADDVLPLRLFVLRDLPLGHDADYEAISFGPVDRHGNIICDHSQTSVTDISGQRAYGVYARRAGESNLTLIDNLDDEEEAEPLAKVLAEQLQQIKEGRYDI